MSSEHNFQPVRTAGLDTVHIQHVFPLPESALIVVSASGWTHALGFDETGCQFEAALVQNSAEMDSCILYFATQRLTQIVFRFDSKTITIPFQLQSMPDNQEILACLLEDNWQDILAVVGSFSEDWHFLVKKFTKICLKHCHNRDLKKKDKKTFEKLSRILPKWQPTGWHSHIDTFDGLTVSGWAKPLQGAGTPLDLYLDNACIVKDFSPGEYREDLEMAGIGAYAFNLSIANGQPDQVPCFSLRDAASGRIVDFRFFSFPEGLSDYRIFVDHLQPFIAGWAVNTADPDEIFELELLVDGHKYQTLRNDLVRPDLQKAGLSNGLGGFACKNPQWLLYPGKHTLNFQILGENIHLGKELNLSNQFSPAIKSLDCLAEPLAIAIVLREDSQEIRLWLDALIHQIDEPVRWIFALWPGNGTWIKGYLPDATILQECWPSETAAINSCLAAAKPADTLLIAPLTRLYGRWLQSLRLQAAYPAALAISPVVELAETASDPGEEARARSWRRRSNGQPDHILLGDSRCILLKGHWLNERLDAASFPLDADSFPNGDAAIGSFCMSRVRQGGEVLQASNILAFAPVCLESTPDQWDLFARMYPECAIYRPLYASRCQTSPYKGEFHPDRLRILYILGPAEGGTPQTSMDLLGKMGAWAQCFLLQCDTKVMCLSAWKDGKLHLLQTRQLPEQLNYAAHFSPEYDAAFAGWLYAYDIDLVHVRCNVFNSIHIYHIAKELGCKVVQSFHDFYILNPNLNLVDDTGVFLGTDLLAKGSDYRTHLWSTVPPVHDSGFVRFWQNRFQDAIATADAFVTTSVSVREEILHHLPKIPEEKFHVIPHGRDFEVFCHIKSQPARGMPIHLLVPGNINLNKGLGIIESLCEYDALHLDCLRFHSLGKLQRKHPRIICHGAYQRDGMQTLLSNLQLHAAVIFSIWNETWCHTLTEAWGLGLPAFVFDIGTVAERVRASGAGWVLPLGDTTEIYETIIRIMHDSGEQSRKSEAIASWQRRVGLVNSTDIMACSYYDVYCRVLGQGKALRGMYSVGSKDQMGKFNSQALFQNDFSRPINWIKADPGSLPQMLELGMADLAVIDPGLVPPFLAQDIEASAASSHIPMFHLKNYGEDNGTKSTGQQWPIAVPFASAPLGLLAYPADMGDLPRVRKEVDEVLIQALGGVFRCSQTATDHASASHVSEYDVNRYHAHKLF